MAYANQHRTNDATKYPDQCKREPGIAIKEEPTDSYYQFQPCFLQNLRHSIKGETVKLEADMAIKKEKAREKRRRYRQRRSERQRLKREVENAVLHYCQTRLNKEEQLEKQQRPRKHWHYKKKRIQHNQSIQNQHLHPNMVGHQQAIKFQVKSVKEEPRCYQHSQKYEPAPMKQVKLDPLAQCNPKQEAITQAIQMSNIDLKHEIDRLNSRVDKLFSQLNTFKQTYRWQ